jgi:site-specific recombinase XerD
VVARLTHDGRRHYVRLGRRAGVKGVTPHTLRHTFASRLVMAGVDLRTVQELGGWSSLDLVQRYALERHAQGRGRRAGRRSFPDGIHDAAPAGGRGVW